MSRMQKRSMQGALGFAFIKGALNTVKQLDEINLNSEQKFNWNELWLESSKGFVVGGIGGAIIGAIEDHQNSLEKRLNTDTWLFKTAEKLKLRKHDNSFILLGHKADVIMNLLGIEYAKFLATVPFRIGSTEKGTALQRKYDLDIALSFKKGSFRSTADMFNDVFNFLKKKIGKFSIISVRDQKVSIGVFVSIHGKQYKIDVVPKKRSNTGNRDKSGYLFVNDSNFWRDNSSYTKTDFSALNSIRLSETQKRIVILLKNWKLKKSLPLSSHLLENLVLDAYEHNYHKIPETITKKLVMVLTHIADNLEFAVIRSVENTNNILTNISHEEKKKIVNACNKAIEDYYYQPNSIIDNFGKNY